MKKLLTASLLVAMGAMAMAEEITPPAADKRAPQTAAANVKVTAQVVADNLVISDLNGRPIVLDFGKISNQKTSGVSNARIDFKVEKVGQEGSELEGITVTLAGLDGENKVQLLNTNVAAADKQIPASIALNAAEGTFVGKEYVGFIQGTIDARDSKNKAASTYENVLVLNATTK
ncbi:hypothetical protein [Cetobacterium sp. SF1]|uniref:hypothetical protein n=1 Tax=Cetobacterium sp. SF1 TaxID=3417654 RepID=UPI003CEF22AC